ncbi:MAG: hypothetical protein ACRDP5_06730 [Streptosporangiaceae bacterium]
MPAVTMPTLTQPASSTEPIQLLVNATKNGASYNPTGDPVYIAVLLNGTPQPAPGSSAWNTAVWETDPGPQYWASLLLGPLNSGLTLLPGLYIAYLKITDNPAVPIRAGAYVLIT